MEPADIRKAVRADPLPASGKGPVLFQHWEEGKNFAGQRAVFPMAVSAAEGKAAPNIEIYYNFEYGFI